MSAATLEVMTPGTAGSVPNRGSYPIEANTLIRKGWMVGLNAAGNAVPADTIANGVVQILGKSSSTIDNRTGNGLWSGLAGATNVFVEYGVFGWASATGADAITAENAGQPCYALDNQTVALTSQNGTLNPAGFISEVGVDGKIYVQQSAITSTIAGALASSKVNMQLTSGVLAAGTPLAAFADNASSDPGIAVNDSSKAMGVRWNDAASQTPVFTSFTLPTDLDPSQPAYLKVLAAKSGATLADATTFTVTLYAQEVGALDDAGTNLGGVTSAMVGNAAAKTVQELSLEVAVPPTPPCACTLSIQPTNGTLGTDDVSVYAIWLEYTRRK